MNASGTPETSGFSASPDTSIVITRAEGVGTFLPLARHRVAAAARAALAVLGDALGGGFADAGVEIRLVDDGEIESLNRDFLGCEGPTNVLSFPSEEDGDEAAGLPEGIGFALPQELLPPTMMADDMLPDDEDADSDWEPEHDRYAAWAQDECPACEDIGSVRTLMQPKKRHLGSLAISLPTVVREARLYGQDPQAHFCRLLVHGLLHLSGLDHGPDMDELTDPCLYAALAMLS